MSDVMLMLDENMTGAEAARTLQRHKITGAPVVDSEGEIKGVLSTKDLIAYETGRKRTPEGYFHEAGLLAAEPARRLTILKRLDKVRVGELMNPDVISVTSSTPISKVATLMTTRKIRRVLIIDNRRLVGIVTVTDILKAVAEKGIPSTPCRKIG